MKLGYPFEINNIGMRYMSGTALAIRILDLINPTLHFYTHLHPRRVLSPLKGERALMILGLRSTSRRV
jgi:hypothetical protein